MNQVDKRFALIKHDGSILYPYQKPQRATNRFGYAITREGDADRKGGGEYTEKIEEVVKRVVLDGWKVRAKSATSNSVGSSVKLGKHAIKGYWVAPELEFLIQTATIRPISLPGLPLDTLPRNLLLNKTPNALKVISADEERIFREIWTRRGQPAFRQALLNVYSSRCCISGCNVEKVLEAAHIIPHAEGRDFSLTNGLLLRADLHTLFDLNAISIAGDSVIHVAEELRSTEYGPLHGRRLTSPSDLKYAPDSASLALRFGHFTMSSAG